MRVVTFNIQHGRTPAGRVSLSVLGRACAGFEVAVLALQEVDIGVPRSGRADTVAHVRMSTGMHGVFGPAHRVSVVGQYGNALFSRAPLSDVETVRLPRHGRREPRAALFASTGGMSVATAHLSIDEAEASEQLAEVVRLLRERPAPRLLLGDLNLRDPAVPGFDLADTAAPSWPADSPRYRIDHIAVEGLSIESVEVLPPAPVSDHRPLLANIG